MFILFWSFLGLNCGVANAKEQMVNSLVVLWYRKRDWAPASASLTSNFPLLTQLTNHSREQLRF